MRGRNFFMVGKEVVGIHQRVQVEDEAMERGFRGFAIVARHDVLTHRLSQIAAYQEQLEHLIGEGEARNVAVETDKRAREAGNDHTVNP
jgi:hypothetical protein